MALKTSYMVLTRSVSLGTWGEKKIQNIVQTDYIGFKSGTGNPTVGEVPTYATQSSAPTSTSNTSWYAITCSLSNSNENIKRIAEVTGDTYLGVSTSTGLVWKKANTLSGGEKGWMLKDNITFVTGTLTYQINSNPFLQWFGKPGIHPVNQDYFGGKIWMKDQ